MITQCLVLLASFTTAALACSCLRYHPQQHFCRDDYALRVKVVGSLKVDRSEQKRHTPGILRFQKVYYPIRIIKVYKGNMSTLTHLKLQERRAGKVRYVTRLYVPTRISSCSLSLTKGRLYVIMGQIHQRVLHHDLCNWRSTSDRVTSVQLRGLRKQYAKGCECSIRTCPTTGWCKKMQSPTECRWISDEGFGITKCVDRWQICQYNSSSRSCIWKPSDLTNFKNCVNNVNWP